MAALMDSDEAHNHKVLPAINVCAGDSVNGMPNTSIGFHIVIA